MGWVMAAGTAFFRSWCPAAEPPVTVITLSYQACDRLLPPEPIATWWKEVNGEALRWWHDRSGMELAVGAAETGLRSLRLRAVGMPTRFGLVPQLSGWVRESTPVLAPILTAMASRWPGYRSEQIDHGATVCAPHGLLPADDDPAPGLHIALLGHGVAELLRCRVPAAEAMLEQPLPADELAYRLAVLERWQAAAHVVPGPLSVIETGLPARWFKPVDGAVIDHLPADTWAWMACAIDGARVSADLHADLAAHGLSTLWPASLIPLPDAAFLSQLLEGTWLVAACGDGFLVRAPRSALLDIVLAFAASARGVVLPEGLQPVEAGPHAAWARSADEWVLADSPARIAAWFQGSTHSRPPLPSGTPLAGGLQRQATARVLKHVELGEELPSPLWDLLALPARARPPVAPGTSGDGDWPAMIQQLAIAGDERLVGRDAGGQLVLGGDGPLLTWLIPAAALRWFADSAEDEEGRIHLRAELQRLAETHLPLTGADYLSVLPPVDPVRHQAWQELLAKDQGFSMPLQYSLRNRLDKETVPWPRGELGASTDRMFDNLVQRTAFASTASAFPQLLWTVLDPPLVESPMAAPSPHLARVARALGQEGLVLCCHGDARGLQLLDRLVALTSPAINLATAYSLDRHRSYRDVGYVIAITSGALDAAHAAAWLAEPADERLPLGVVRGERIFSTMPVAQRWLAPELSTQAAATASDAEVGGPLAFIQQQRTRAQGADDLAEMIAWERMSEAGDEAMWSANSKRTRDRYALSDIPALHSQLRSAAIRHQLFRYAARLELLNRTGRLPRTQDEAIAAVGALSAILDGATIPLTYQHLGVHAFRLLVAPTVPAPAQCDVDWWRSQLPPIAGTPDRRLVVTSRTFEVAVDDPVTGVDDF